MRKLLAILILCLAPALAWAQAVTPPGTAALVCAYNTSPPALTSGLFAYVQCDSAGKLITSGGGGGGSGTVTSVGETFTGGLISVAGSPITTAGTFALSVAGTSGGIPYFSSASTWATSAALTANSVVLGGGAGAAPSTGGAGTIASLAVGGATLGSAVFAAAGANNAYTATIAGGSVTGSGTNGVGLNITGTLNTSGVGPGALIFANLTNTAAGSGSTLMDLQVGSISKLKLQTSGIFQISSSGFEIGQSNAGATNRYIVASNAMYFSRDVQISWSSSSTDVVPQDLFLFRKAAATLQLGAPDAAAPVAQTLGVQSVVAGTSNTAGSAWTLTGSLSTGTGTSGDIILKTGATGTTGTTQNAATTALTIKGATQRVVAATTIATGGYTVATLPAGVVGDRAYVTDQTAACVAVGAALTGGGAVTCPTFYNGSAWVGG